MIALCGNKRRRSIDMTNYIKVSVVTILLSTLWGCTANSKHYAMSETQAKANRDYTARLQQEDRDRDHIERMRRADAISHATRNVKGGVIYSPTTTTVIVPR